MNHAITSGVRHAGIDVLTAAEAGLIRREDERHLEFATSQGRVLYSYNVGDYLRIHTAWLDQQRPHAGIILARQRKYSVRDQITLLVGLLRTRINFTNTLEFLKSV